MGIFDKMKEPVFLKESSDAERRIERLKAVESLYNSEGQEKIRKDIKLLEYGIFGEKTIAFELRNSHMPMYILHDIYLADGDLTAQIDYLVFTRKICFVIECKNLFGDIDMNNAGDFIRTTEYGGRKTKEGIYSPITQNQRHLELMKKIKLDNSKNIIKHFMTGKYFEEFNKSVVVLANPKTVFTAKYAKKEVKEKVIRADQLVKFIKESYKQSKEEESSDSNLLSWAQSYITLHQDVEKDYTSKYQQYLLPNIELLPVVIAEDIIVEKPASAIITGKSTRAIITEKTVVVVVTEKLLDVVIPEKIEDVAIVNVEDTEIFKELRAYRLTKSRAENIKPYFIYNDKELKDLICKMPRSIADLQEVAGFNVSKTNKYGKDIIGIVCNYIN